MKTWNQETKDHWVKVMQEHQDMDRLRAGSWWNGEKGCFFGCAMQADSETLEKAIKVMQLPPWLIYLSEKIFEGLKDGSDEQLSFPVRLLKSIPVNADISSVEHDLAIIRLTKLSKNNPSVSHVIDPIISLHTVQALEDDGRWKAAESAAASAAESAARSASAAAAEAAAGSAAWSAAGSSARSAAWSAEWSAAESAARSAEWKGEADNLIKLLGEIK